MRVHKSILLLTLLLLSGFGSGRVFAQDELTLDDCIEIALQKRASIIAAYGNEQLASASRLNALGAFLPHLSASYSYGKGKQTDRKQDALFIPVDSSIIVYDTGHTSDGTSDSIASWQNFYGDSYVQEVQYDDQDLGTSKSLGLSASISVFDLGNFFDYASANANRAIAKLNVIASEQDLIYSVKVYYYAYLASVENLTTQEEAVKRAEEQLKLIESKYELGSVSRSDVLKQKVQFGNDRLALLNAKNGITNARANLAYAIGLDPREDYRFSHKYTTREYEGSLEEAIEFGLTHKPSLLASEKSVDYYKHSYRSAKSLYLPSLSAHYSYNISSGSQGDTLIYDFSQHTRSWGLTASWNIFDGFSRERQLTSAKVSLNNAKAEMADERNLAVSNIKKAYLNIEQLKLQQEVSRENVEAAQEDLKITQEKYNLGAAAILEVLDAQVSLKEAQVSLIQAEFDLNLAIAELENAMGKM
ncbi:MAG: TolC family protein [Candidatus Zixiibacteriota bacterium]